MLRKHKKLFSKTLSDAENLSGNVKEFPQGFLARFGFPWRRIFVRVYIERLLLVSKVTDRIIL
jgi:hypothetical protein